MQKQEGNHLEITKIVGVREQKVANIEQATGLCCWLDKKHNIIPKIGDVMAIRTHGQSGWGGQIMGIQINEKVAFDKTNADIEKEHKEFCENFHREEWESYYKYLEQIKNEEPFETVDISGMSGGYEATCQKMLRAGIKFLSEHKDFHFDYETYKGVYGVCSITTPWGKDLDKVLDEAANNDCTGAMHQCVIGHLYQIHKHSIEWWLKQFPKTRRYTYPSGLPQPKYPKPASFHKEKSESE